MGQFALLVSLLAANRILAEKAEKVMNSR